MKKIAILILLLLIDIRAENIILDSNQSEKIRNKLLTTLENVKRFKTQKNNQIRQLTNELALLRKKFATYKIKKEKEIQKIRRQLKKSKRELLKREKKLKEMDDLVCSNLYTTMQKAMDEPIEVSPERESVVEEIIPSNQINLPWVEIVVEDGIDIYQLALKYYGNKEEYRQIYAANRQALGESLHLNDGMSLKIPISERFEDQPMILNLDP